MDSAPVLDVDPESIWIFSAIDKFMAEHKASKHMFLKLFQRKNDLINLVQDLKIDAQRYKKIMKKAYKSENQLVKACAADDLLKLQDPKDPAKCFQWFKEMIDQTGKFIQQQEVLHKHFTKSIRSTIRPISAIKSIIRQTQIRKTSRIAFKQEQIDEKQIVSLKAADNVLKKCHNMPATYERVLDRKMKMISLINKKELTAQRYKKNLEQYLPNIKNEDILFDTKLQLEAIADFNQGNIDVWFNQIVEEAKESWKQQKKIMLKLNPTLRSGIYGSQSMSGSARQVSYLAPSSIPSKQSRIQPTQVIPSTYPPSQLPEKSTIVESSRINKQISAEVPSTIVKTMGIKNIHSFGVIEKLLEDTSEDQSFRKDMQTLRKQLLQQHKNGSLTPKKYKQLIQNDLKQSQNEDIRMCIELELSLLHDIHEGNIEEWFNDIVEASTDLIAQEKTEKQQNPAESQIELGKSSSNFLGDDKPQQKMKVSYVRSQRVRQSSIAQTAPVKNKVTESQLEFLKQMAAYESWLYLCRKNQIPYDSHKYLMKYLKEIRVKTDDYLKKIEKDKEFKVDQLIIELFPPITEDIFYAGQLEKYQKQTVPKMIQCFEKEQAALKHYISNIKKQCNQQNIQTANQEIIYCAESINYLKKWPNSKFEPLPIFSQEKIIKYHIDSNKLELNQLELELVEVHGVTSKLALQIYVGSQTPILQRGIDNGSPGIKVVGKCSEEAMKEIMRGKGQHLRVVLVQKGFFGADTVKGQQYLQPIFTRSNSRQCQAQIGGVKIKFQARVQKAGQPLTTELTHCTLKKLPRYEHSRFIEEELIKKHMLYSNPTSSQILQK